MNSNIFTPLGVRLLKDGYISSIEEEYMESTFNEILPFVDIVSVSLRLSNHPKHSKHPFKLFMNMLKYDYIDNVDDYRDPRERDNPRYALRPIKYDLSRQNLGYLKLLLDNDELSKENLFENSDLIFNKIFDMKYNDKNLLSDVSEREYDEHVKEIILTLYNQNLMQHVNDQDKNLMADKAIAIASAKVRYHNQNNEDLKEVHKLLEDLTKELSKLRETINSKKD